MKNNEVLLASNSLFTPSPEEGRDILITTIHQFSESLGVAIDAKDPYTKCHSVEVAEVAHAMAGWLGLAPQEAELIHIGGHLHDIGKIGVSDSVLNKPGRLTAGEWIQMKKHPQVGAEILAPIKGIAKTGLPEMVLHHHEWFDGTGYPMGLSGPQIPMGARIIAVADTFSAMLSHRSYRPAKEPCTAMRELARCSGTQFDPVVVESLLDHWQTAWRIFEELKQQAKRH